MIALFGISADFLLPGLSPGISLPQLLLIVSGLGLALSATLINRVKMPDWLSASAYRRTTAVTLIVILNVLALEFLLTVVGVTTYFPAELREVDVEIAPWWTCDELGCRLEYHAAVEACAAGLLSKRHCKVNTQGFGDSKEFVIGTDFAERTRILVLGDSFAQGYAADLGNSFVEVLEAALPEAVIWNLGVSGTGTSQALASFERFGPMLKPDLAILAFYMNDFQNNLVPLSGWIQLRDAEGRLQFVRPTYLDRWGNTVEWPLATVFAYAEQGYKPPLNELERLIGMTRLGSSVLRLLDRLGSTYSYHSLENQVRITRRYLAELKHSTAEQESTFLVLLIPDREDISSPGEHFTSAVQLMDDLEIPYVRLDLMLEPVGDYAHTPDVHWNNSGHKKVGGLPYECIAHYIERGDLVDCRRVIMR